MTYADWERKGLGDLFEIGAGRTMSKAARDGTNKVPFLRTSNVLWDRIDLSSLDEMAIPASELPEKLLRPGDLLVCEGGEIGRAAVWNGEVDVCSFQNHLHRLRPRGDDVDPRFYVYFLQSAFTQLGLFEGAGNRTTIPNLSQNRLASFTVPHPPLPEQRAIVEALGAVRSSIDVQERSASLLGELKQAGLRRVFSCGLRGEPQKETEIGPVPESWNVIRLDSTADVISTRMSYSHLESVAPSTASDAVPVLGIKVSDMNRVGNEVAITQSSFQIAMDDAIVRTRCAPPGTIVFPKRGAAIATNKKRIATTWTVFDPNIIGVRARPGLNQRFLFHWFQGFDLRTITEPGPTPQLNKKNLDPLSIPVPSDQDEQTEVVRLFDALDAKIDLHRHKHSLALELFRSLLRNVMTGAVNAEDLDTPAVQGVVELRKSAA